MNRVVMMLVRRIGIVILIIILAGVAFPQEFTMPVDGATERIIIKSHSGITHGGNPLHTKA
ncbi:hypothetical protein TH61_16265 [Rufibacter sp. DG15C]|nr:hypothetical protein TH61_16265 [Rufibacter sp. DG15C]